MNGSNSPSEEKSLYRKGALVIMQRGEYSDKSTIGLFRVLRDFYPADAVERYKERFPADDADFGWSYNEWDNKLPFELMLIQDGYLEELDYSVMHTGSYSDLEIT